MYSCRVGCVSWLAFLVPRLCCIYKSLSSLLLDGSFILFYLIPVGYSRSLSPPFIYFSFLSLLVLLVWAFFISLESYLSNSKKSWPVFNPILFMVERAFSIVYMFLTVSNLVPRIFGVRDSFGFLCWNFGEGTSASMTSFFLGVWLYDLPPMSTSGTSGWDYSI